MSAIKRVHAVANWLYITSYYMYEICLSYQNHDAVKKINIKSVRNVVT